MKNLKSSLLSNSSTSRNILEKVKLTNKSKTLLILKTILITLVCAFFPFEYVVSQKLENIETKLYQNNAYFFYSIIFKKETMAKESFQKVINYLMEIIGGTYSLIVYISFIYLIYHPFIGLKLVFVINISHFFLVILKVFLQGRRPLWDIEIEKTICKNDYANPSRSLYFSSFFFLYAIISIKLVQKYRITICQKLTIFFWYLIIISILIIFIGGSILVYFHQLIYTILISVILLCLLIEYDKKIHNFIFKSLKNIYNTRIYKMKIFFYIIGIFCVSIIFVYYFIDENEANSIKQILGKGDTCGDLEVETFGIRKSISELNYIFGVVGAFWGASFTVEKNIGKWWGENNCKTYFVKILSIIGINGVFIFVQLMISSYFNINELVFIINSIFNFFQYFCLFGILPFLWEMIKITEKKKDNVDDENSVLDNNEEEIMIFRTSIFKNEKQNNDDGFVVVNKVKDKKNENATDENKKLVEEDAKNKIDETSNMDLSDDDTKIDDKNKRKEIYVSTSLVEKIERRENEEDMEFFIEGIDDQ